MMPSKFQDKVIWITGASSGIGEALTQGFAERGARIVLSARNQRELARVRDACISAGASADDLLIVPLDVTDHAAMPGATAAILEKFGGIDLLMNNAGISQRSFFADTQLDVYRTLFEVDVLGQIALTQSVYPQMVKQGAGHIAVTSSVAGKVGAPLRTGYCAAKHAVMGFFDALRTEVAHQNIKVTTITPGFIRTNVSKNALTGDGSAAGQHDEDISGGMTPAKCVEVIFDGLENGVEEIAVGDGQEMQLLELKRQDPSQAFRVLEGMAEQIRRNS